MKTALKLAAFALIGIAEVSHLGIAQTNNVWRIVCWDVDE
jgi:hypothetical protein